MKSIAQPRQQRFGPLDAIEFPASEDSPVIVCMHGYGADAANLAPLAAQLDLAKPARWLFPEGPLEIEFDPFTRGRAWFPIDEARMAEAQMSGRAIDLSSLRPAGFDDALATISEFIDAAKIPWSKLILGGFSQGAMLAVESVLRAPRTPLGLFILSGTLVDGKKLLPLTAARTGLRFFQSHGTYDTMLGYEEAKNLNKLLNAAGLQGELSSFPGGHELHPQAAEGLRKYFNSVLENVKA